MDFDALTISLAYMCSLVGGLVFMCWVSDVL